MKKNILFFFCLIVLLTGCKAQYNLKFTENNFSENIRILSDNITDSNLNFAIAMNSNDENSPYDYYKIEKLIDNNFKGVNVSYIYDYAFNAEIGSFESCYTNYDFIISDNNIVINTKGQFRCFNYFSQADVIEINIETDFKVISNNADKVTNNVYTWFLKEDNLYKQISIVMDRNNKVATNNALIFLIIGGLVLFAVLCLIFAKILNKKNNKV